jgi:transcriptional regulator with XRE-family HTH domain
VTRKGQYRDKEFIANVAKRLAALCKEKNIGHELLSERTGFDTRQIGRILRGESNTSISHFAQVCRGIGMHPSEVLLEIDFPLNKKFIDPLTK